MAGKDWKSALGTPPGHPGSAPASVRCFALHSGLRIPPPSGQVVCPEAIFNLAQPTWKKKRFAISKEVSAISKIYATYQPKKLHFLYNIGESGWTFLDLCISGWAGWPRWHGWSWVIGFFLTTTPRPKKPKFTTNLLKNLLPPLLLPPPNFYNPPPPPPRRGVQPRRRFFLF